SWSTRSASRRCGCARSRSAASARPPAATCIAGVPAMWSPSYLAEFPRAIVGRFRRPAAKLGEKLQTLAVADDADRDALDGERLAPQVDLDRLEFRVLRQELDRMAAASQALDRHFVSQAGDDDLAGARVVRAVHREEVAFDDAGVAHGHAAYAQQVVRPRREQVGVHLIAPLHVLLGEHRAARGDTADHRQLEQAAEARALARVAHADAARGARGDLDRPLFLERTQVLLGGIDRAKAHALGDFRARRGVARDLGQLAHEAQDFALAFGERVH